MLRLQVPSSPSLMQALSHLCSGMGSAPTRGAPQSSTSSALLPPETALTLLSSSTAERQGPGLCQSASVSSLVAPQEG